MIEHIVLFKPKTTTTAQQEDELIQMLRAMRGQIPGIVDLSAGRNFSERGRGNTIGLVVRFTDHAALEAYATHPVHLPVVQRVREIMDEVTAVDYEI